MRKKGLLALLALTALPGIPGILVLVVALAYVFPSIGTKLFNLFPKRRNTRATLRNAFASRGLNPDWIDAIAYVESRWNVNAVNRTGGDALRGGSYGASQMSQKTLRSIGYSAPIEDFLGDASLQGKWSAIYMLKANPQSFADAVAWWNAGRKHFEDLPLNHSTRLKYFPKAEKALAYVAISATPNPPEAA